MLGPTSGWLIGKSGRAPEPQNASAAGDGISKYNYTWPTVVAAPRFGLAYDVSGAQRMVLRGGIGLFHDRPAGDTMYSQVGNPGFSTSRTVRYALLQQLASGLEILGPPQLTSVWPYEAKIPSSTQWNAGVQMTCRGLHHRRLVCRPARLHQLREIRGQTQVDINAVDFEAAFLPQKSGSDARGGTTPGASRIRRPVSTVRGLGQVGFNFPEFRRPITRSRPR